MKMKETFCSYTDFTEDDTKKLREEMEELKNELNKTRNIVRVQRVRYQQLVSLFSAKLQEKEEETRNDLQIKHIQLTRILRALYILEAKLRKEQRYLNTTLIERDGLIKTQQIEITKLKKELENRCDHCVKLSLQPKPHSQIPIIDSESKTSDNKPDLISSIGIEKHKDAEANSRLSRELEPDADTKMENEENTYVIATLDDYDASLSLLHVRETGANETKDIFPPSNSSVRVIEHQQNANKNLRNRIIDEKLQNKMRKFKMKETDIEENFKTCSPRMILKEVTENPTEKLKDPVLKCVKQILSVDNESRNDTKPFVKNTKSQETAANLRTLECNSFDDVEITNYKRQHPAKPPKPNFSHGTQFHKKDNRNEPSNVSKMSLHDKTISMKSPSLPNQEKDIISSHLSHHGESNSVADISDMGDRKVLKCETEYCDRMIVDESKIVQTVSTLLSDSAESEDEKCKLSPNVSQMVKKFEGLKCIKKSVSKQASNPLKTESIFQTNFEEFHLVDKEIESTCEDIVKDSAIRLEAEGEENNRDGIIIETTNSSNAKYEAFLKVTGVVYTGLQPTHPIHLYFSNV